MQQLESLETRWQSHNDKARMHILRVSQKIGNDYERIRTQGA